MADPITVKDQILINNSICFVKTALFIVLNPNYDPSEIPDSSLPNP